MAFYTSSIGQALAGKSASIDIVKPSTVGIFNNRDTYAAVAARGGCRMTGLPTPPNSVSPTIPACGFGTKTSKGPADSAPFQVDSDIELLEALDHANTEDLPERLLSTSESGTSSSESTAYITPTYLAKHHLPTIILEKGPIAIRAVMHHLAQVVPSFGQIPPAKARRIVVSALENHSGEGLEGDVVFEKVGWGRWDARGRDQALKSARNIHMVPAGNISPPLSAASSWSPSNNLNMTGRNGRHVKARRHSHGSWAGDTAAACEQGEGMHQQVDEHNADKMSIDEEDDDRVHKATRIHHFPSKQEDFYSDTDEEDWESLGPPALGLSAYHPASILRKHKSNSVCSSSRRRSPTPSRAIPTQDHSYHPPKANPAPVLNLDTQEREAIDALLRMGSV